MASELEQQAIRLAVQAEAKADPFTLRVQLPQQINQYECPHASIRQANNGWCVLCQGGQPLSIDEELEQLEAEEAAAQEELAELDRDAMVLDLSEFVRGGWHVLEPAELEWNWHHEALCKNVQGMIEEWIKRKEQRFYVMRWHKLAINICPTSLKSRIIMVFAVAWVWLRYPTFQWLCISGNPANVNRDSEACHDLVTNRWYTDTFSIAWSIRPDIDSKAKWQTTAGGLRLSRGMASKFTGIHVDGILVDDPDDAKDVWSESERKSRAAKIESLSSRLNDKRRYIFIVLQQRVHVDDCTGEMLSRGGSILHANYAALYDDGTRHDTPFYNDPRHVKGENMHELRLTTMVIAEAKVELGTHGFESQYNGNPAPLDGGMFGRKWLRYFTIANMPVGMYPRPKDTNVEPAYVLERKANGKLDLDWMAITVDATFGGLKETNSAVGLLCMGGKGPKRFIFMDRTKQMSYPDTKQAIRDLLRDYPAANAVLVERKANGQAIIDELSAEFSGLIGIEASEHYISRAYAMSPAIESGCLYVLEGEMWLEPFIGELTLFPNGAHDDRVDALAQLMAFYRADTDAMKLAAKNAAFKTLAAAKNRMWMTQRRR